MGSFFLFEKTTASIHNSLLRLNSRGSMLVQVLISAGLTVALALTLASLLLQQNKQIKLIEQKSEIIDIKNEILMALSNPQVCGCNLNPSKLIPLGTKPAIEFSSSPANFSILEGLRTNCEISIPTFLSANKKMLSGVEIDFIQISNLKQTSNSATWLGRLEVGFKNTNIKLKNISLPLRAETTVNSSGFYQVEQCMLGDSSNSSKIPGRLVFESSGVFNVPEGVKLVRVTVIGGGGGGGYPVSCGSADHAGGGGGGGEAHYSKDVVIPTGATNIPITVGQGGLGGGSSANPAGNDGGMSSFGNYIIANGGKGAPVVNWGPGCKIAFKGGQSGGLGGSPGSAGVSATDVLNIHRSGGIGGGTLLGMGGPPISAGNTKTSATPSGYGGGGGGGDAKNTGGGGTYAGVGDDGASGVVIVEW